MRVEMSNPKIHSTSASTKRSVRHYSPRENMNLLEPHLYQHMFEEDIHLGIMPIGAQSSRPDFKISIAPSSAEMEELITQGLPTFHGEAHSLADAVCSFVDDTAHMMGHYGRVYYEIVYTGENLERPTAFSLQQIQTRTIHSLWGLHWQYIPRKTRRDEGRCVPTIIRLPRRNLMTLYFPATLGGKREHHRLMRGLKYLDKSSVPKFFMDDMKRLQQTPSYDFTVHRNSMDTYLGKTTRLVGWNARSMTDDICLEYYRLHRYIKFERTKALLREHILDSLNATISYIGKKMGFKAQIQVQGLPSSRDLYALMNRLKNGDIPFLEIFNATRF